MPFTIAQMKGNTLDFSFSGLKTAVLRWTQARDMRPRSRRGVTLLRTEPAADRRGVAGGDAEGDARYARVVPGAP